VAIGGLDVLAQQYALRAYRLTQHEFLLLKLSSLRQQLENELTANLQLLQGTANFIAVTEELTEEEFNEYARLTLTHGRLLKNLTAAPDFIMKYVYPLEGNEAILNVDYRTIPTQWPKVQQAHETGKMVIAGPLRLLQGGTGLIGRAPVNSLRNGTSTFWGIVSAVIDMDALFTMVGEDPTIKIALRGADSLRDKGAVFLGDETLFTDAALAIVMPVHFPSGRWLLAGLPAGGWATQHPQSPLIHVFAILLGATLILSTARHLRRNAEVTRAQALLSEAQAVAHLGNWDHNPQTDELWWSDEVYAIFGVDKHEFTPSLQEFLQRVHPEDREFVTDAYTSAVEQGRPYAFDHRIVRADGAVRHIKGTGETKRNAAGTPIRSFGTVQDITDQKLVEEALQAEQGKLRAMAEASYDAFIMIDAKDTIHFWSPAAVQLFGWTEDEAVGSKMHALITPPEYHAPAHEGLQHFAHTGKGPVINSVSEFMAVRKDGTLFPVERSVSAFRRGNEFFAVGQLRDITERKAAEEALERLATTDNLTGLFNRGHFVNLARTEIDRCRRYSRPLSLLMVDADKFKSVNDTYGHDVGDMVLRAISATIVQALRTVDIVGRLGGEEFVALLPETGLKDAVVSAERVRRAIEEQSVTLETGDQLRFTVSIGVSTMPDGDCDTERCLDDMLKESDKALYDAKHAGRNRVCTTGTDTCPAAPTDRRAP